MSSFDRPPGSTFALPDRTAPESPLPIYPSNVNRPDLKNQGLWTNKQYEETDAFVRQTIEDLLKEITGGPRHGRGMLRPGNTPGEVASYAGLIQIFEKAKSHPSNTVRRNLMAIADGIHTGSTWMDNDTFCEGGCQDPELDVDSSRGAKFRIMEAMIKEAELLGTKELESVMYYLEIALGGMREALACWRLRWGWDDWMMQFHPPHQGYVPKHEDYVQQYMSQ